MVRLSQAPPGQQPHRIRTRRPFQVIAPGVPRFSTAAAARLRAQQVADRDGRPVDIYDHDRGWLPAVQPVQLRCQRCQNPVPAAEWPEVWKHHCRACRGLTAEFPPMPRKRKTHAIPDSGFHQCQASFPGSQSRCGCVFHALEIDPNGATPCGHLVAEHGTKEVSLPTLGHTVRVSDLQRCRGRLVQWVLNAPTEKLLESRMQYGRLLVTRPEPENPIQAAWAMLWWANNAEAAAWLRRQIEERLSAEGHEAAA